MGVPPGLHHSIMWTKWRGSLFLLTWVILQVPCPAVSGLRHKTACYNFLLMVDYPCAATEMLLPTMFTLGVSSDVTCHSEITGTSLRQKGVDEIIRCCQQRENDTVTDYCLPAMKNQLPDHYYLDFVNTCTAAARCQLSSPEDTVLHIQRDSTHTGQEVYLYNDQHDGMAHAFCLAYSHECNSHVIIQLAATRVVSPACSVDFTDGDVSTKVDCKNPPASRNCSSAMFESKSNYVNMSILMTVDPGRQEKEFLWMRAKSDTGENVTVVCGANIPADVSLNCPASTSTTTTSTASESTPLGATPSTEATSPMDNDISTPAATTETVPLTQETLPSTEETLLSTEETFLSTQETLLSTEETFLSTQETLLSTEETFLSTQETLLSTEETFLSTQETLSSTEETPSKDIQSLKFDVKLM